MSEYAKIKRLDEKSLRRLKEGSGPADECLCSILRPSQAKKGFRASVRKAFGALSGKKKATRWPTGTGYEKQEMPQNVSRGLQGIHGKKEVVRRKNSCGKCGCDNEKFTLKHSYANIRITTPDISIICPCPSGCLPDKENLRNNNIKVTVENAEINSQPKLLEHRPDV